jgi:hypothetical protein
MLLLVVNGPFIKKETSRLFGQKARHFYLNMLVGEVG